MDYKKHAGLRSGEKSDSNHPSRKSSSSSSDFNGYKIDKYDRGSSRSSVKSSDSLNKKKRKRSLSRDNKYDSKSLHEDSKLINKKAKSKSRSPPRLKNKVTSLLNEKNSSQVFIPGFDGPLVSLSLFNELQHNLLPTQTIESAYKEYKTKYEQKRYKSFYVEHKEDEWFKEKYDPQINQKVTSERNAQCQKLAAKFVEAVKHLNLKLELRELDECNKNVKIMIYGYNREKDEFEEKEREMSLLINKTGTESVDISSSPYYAYDPDSLTLFLHQIPRHISRFQILEVLKKLPGFIFLSLSEPIKSQSYSPYCWITFDTESNLDLAYESLNDYRIAQDYKLAPIKSKSSTLKRIRVTPAIFDERLAEDLELTKSLINMLDKEKGVESNVLLDNSRSKEAQLDVQILYLRRVHGFCYYCLEEFEDERALATKCDNIHLRSYKRLGARKQDEEHLYETEWDKNFTRMAARHVSEKAKDISKSSNSQVNEELNKRRNDYCKENTSAVNDERFVCNICSKMFKGSNFVYNHVFNKHANLIQESVDKDFYDNLKHDNYLNDPSRTYDKYKVISSMDDYLYYLNTMKSFQQGANSPYDPRRSTSGGKYYKESRDRGDTDRRRGRKDFKDYDNPQEVSLNTQTSGRKLISYDDL